MRRLACGLCLLALGCGGRATLEDGRKLQGSGGMAGAGSAGSGAAGDPGGIAPSEPAPVAKGVDVHVFNDKDAPGPRRDTPPTTCDDVGTFVGTSSCCKDDLCIGSCSRKNCQCGRVEGGCPWPLVCCGASTHGDSGACVGPDSPICRTPGKGQNEKDTRPLVVEGDGCGVPSMPNGIFSRMCCNGEVCQGRCTLYPELGKGVCDCNYAVGGCPPPLECCWPGGCVPKGQCREPMD